MSEQKTIEEINAEWRLIEEKQKENNNKEIKELRKKFEEFEKIQKTPLEVRVERLELIMADWRDKLFDETPGGKEKLSNFGKKFRSKIQR